MGSIFDDIPEALGSPAFMAYCDMVYGHGLRLDDALIEEDVDALAAFAERARGGRILDAGCGSGDLLRFICEKTDAEGVGIDPSPACFNSPLPDTPGTAAESVIAAGEPAATYKPAAVGEPVAAGSLFAKALAHAKEPGSLFLRARAYAEGDERTGRAPLTAIASGRLRPESRTEGRLTFIKTTAQECLGVEGRFKLIIAIDSLAECRDKAAALDRLIGCLEPGGELLIAHTERLEPKDPRLGFSATSVARALKLRGMEIRGHELTRSEKLHWKLSRRLMDALGEGCAAEGNGRIRDRLDALTMEMTASVEQDDFRRYWYRVRKPGGALK